MKVVILAGGKGSRLGSLTESVPKPMIKVGNLPILIHVMNIYSSYGHKDFIIALGYKSEIIKKYFLDRGVKNKSTNDKQELNITFNQTWSVTLVDTGINTMTGGRLKRIKKYLKNETFMLTYGDGLANINLSKLHNFHKRHGKMVSITAVHPIARFGELKLIGNKVKSFKEKPQTSKDWINGGFFILEKEFIKYIKSDQTVLEALPLELSAYNGNLMAFKHQGFWYCMDTIRDKNELDLMLKENRAPWI